LELRADRHVRDGVIRDEMTVQVEVRRDAGLRVLPTLREPIRRDRPRALHLDDEEHIRGCKHCAAVLDGTSNTLIVSEKRLNLANLGQEQPDDNEGYTAGWDEDTRSADTTTTAKTKKKKGSGDNDGTNLTWHFTRPSADRVIIYGLNEKKDSIYAVLDKINREYPIALKPKNASL